MKFNICYDIVSLVVLLIVTFRFYKYMRFPVFSNRLFGVLLVLGNLNLIFDISATLFISNVIDVPIWFTYLINSLYYIVQLIMGASILIFLIALIAVKTKVDRKYYLISLIPVFIFIMIFLVALPFGKVFVIRENGEYIYGPFSFITYACVGLYLAIVLIVLQVQKKNLTTSERASMYFLCLIVIVATVFQKIYPTELLSGSAIAMAFLIMFFAIQDPRYFLDPVTNVFTGDAMKKLFDYYYARNKNFHLAVIKLHGLHGIHMLYGRNAGNAALTNLSDFLLSFNKSFNFRAGDSLFLTSFKTLDELYDFSELFDEFRKKPQLCDNVSITQRYTMLCVKDVKYFKNTRELMAVIENAFDDSNIIPIKQKITFLTDAQIIKHKSNVVIEENIKNDLPTGNNFFMKYQPIYSTKRNKFISAEALIRYNSDSLGVVKPSDLMPIIEQRGLATQLDYMVVKMVFSDIKNDIFKKLDLESIHVNLSAATFFSKDTISEIVVLAKKMKIDPGFVTFEITETETSLSEKLAIESSNILRKAGFGLALDDFGTGYANIKRAAKFPFTHVKLDRILVQETPNLVKYTIALFRGLNLHIIAEGVETSEHNSLIVDNDVDLIQGFYYSKPLTINELKDLLKNRK